MATKAGVPKWLSDSKDYISTTKEWKGFVGELQQAIQQQLKESHVSSFADLTDPERSLFLDRAAKAIHSGQIYRDFFAKVSHSLDQHINNEVARQLMEEFPLETKSDLIVEKAQEGAMSLLRCWPEMKWKLRACFNQPLPGPIRQLAWRLYLENTKLRKIYTKLLSGNARSAISPADQEISQKCDYLLKAEPTFEDLCGSLGAFYGMKAVLSYYHTQKKTNLPLSDIEYMLIVPFVEVSSNKMSRREPAPGKLVALLVEEYITFIEGRPGYMVDSGSEEDEKEIMSFAQRVVNVVRECCPEVAQAVTTAYTPDKDQIVASQTGAQKILNEGMTTLIRPVIRSLFVGYLSLDVVLYIWDQYIIGSDVSGFLDLFLPVAMGTHLYLLRDKLKECTSPAAMETTLKLESSKLKVHQFQQQIKLHHYGDLIKVLTQDDRSGLPVLDPTQAQYAPWTHWYSENIPPRVGVQERRQAREERDAERNQQLNKYREAEQQRRNLEEQQRKEDYLKFIEQQEANKFVFDREKVRLEELLQAERKHRIEAEQSAAAEVERLRQQVEELRQPKLRSANPSHRSLDSMVSQFLIPPPPTAMSMGGEPLAENLHSPSQNKPPNELTEGVILDFLRRVAMGFNTLGHGSGSERDELDGTTEENINIHKEDIKQAQREVFGRQLSDQEYEDLPKAEKEEAGEKMMAVVRRRMHERRQVELTKQGT